MDMKGNPHLSRYGRLVAASLLLGLAPGCLSPLNLFKKDEAPRPGGDSMVLGAGIRKAAYNIDPKVQAELDEGKKHFMQNEYGKAEPIFAKLAKNTRNPLPIAEEARFLQAECQRLEGDYRTAEATYKKLLQDFHHGEFADQANHRLFDIANYWLDDTRKQMQAYEALGESKFRFVKPLPLFNLKRDKPLTGTEGRALACLETVRLNDISGPLGEKALFYLATVKFYRAEYADADYFYSQVYANFPRSPLATKAIKQAIICKQMAAGGSVYDCRSLEEARKLIDTAQRAFPELAAGEEDWLRRQLVGISLYQADRDFKIAEFYRRTSHPGSAYFYYELVRRRYPGTDYADKAVERLEEMRAQVEENHASLRDQVASEASGETRPWWQFWPASRQKGADRENSDNQRP